MKKWLKTLIIIVSVLLVLVLAGGLYLYYSSPKYIIEHKTIDRVYIYHNELGRELYEFTDEEKTALSEAVKNADIGSAVLDGYEAVTGGPWFSFFCEMENGVTVQLYAVGEYLHINSVPFTVDSTSAEKLSALHASVENKILPISPELLEEILNNRENV